MMGFLVRDLERTRLENWCQGILGKSCADGPIRMCRLWRYLCPIWIPTHGFLLQSRLLTRWTKWGSLWMLVSFSPKTECFLFMPMKKVAIGQGWRLCLDQQNGLPLTRADLPKATAEFTTESPVWQHSMEGPADKLLAGWLHCTPSITVETETHSYWNRHIVWVWTCLPYL